MLEGFLLFLLQCFFRSTKGQLNAVSELAVVLSLQLQIKLEREMP